MLVLMAYAHVIGEMDNLRPYLVLKGGTLLRLFLDGSNRRRPTRDLDASFVCGADEDESSLLDGLERLLAGEAAELCQEYLCRHFDDSFEVSVSKVVEGRGRNDDDLATRTQVYRIKGQVILPGKMTPSLLNGTSFKFDVTSDEIVDMKLLCEPPVLAGLPATRMRAYAPIQSLAEKLRAVIQKYQHHLRVLGEGKKASSGNFPPRHVMDIESLYSLCDYSDVNQVLPDLFIKKCRDRGVPEDLISSDVFFSEALYQNVKDECNLLGRDFETCWSCYKHCVGIIGVV